MYTRTKISAAALIALGSVASLAHAQSTTDTTQQPQQIERVTITGSAIKSVDAETSVPVTVFKMADLKQEGVTTVEQILATLSANQGNLATGQAIGASTGGASFANLRGVGQNKTLVLLNGRRIANNAFDGSAPDLNMIPIAALDRVEILRDGASSLYGTDAIGGVINFITKKDYVGGTVSAEYSQPQHPGGKSHQANAGFGFGDLDKDGYNIFGFIDLQKQDNISGTQRPFNTRYPGGLSGSPSPGNYYQDGTVVGNPTAPSCTTGTFLIPAGDNTSCYMTTSSFVDYVPASQRESGMLKESLKVNPDNILSMEYFVTQSHVKTLIAPVPYGALIQNPIMPNGEANPYYPGNSGNSFTPAFTPSSTFGTGGTTVGTTLVPGGSVIQPGYMNVKWRDLPNGPRGDDNTNTQQRLVLALDGSAMGWDYGVGTTYNQNTVSEKLISGYNNGLIIQEGVLDGVINPFGAQSAAGTALLDSALAVGEVMHAKGVTWGGDAHASRELSDWFGAGRPAAVALGTEWRSEKFTSQADPDYASIVVASTGIDPNTFNSGSRTVSAVYGELQVPILKSLDVTVAARDDKYSDFGNTINPKYSFRFQPTKDVVLRGSYSTGFRAPSLYELHSAQAYTNTGTVNDPVTCPTGTPTQGNTSINNCKSQFESLTGGNLNLKPEKSKTANLGLVVQPIKDLSLETDLWWLHLANQIGSLSANTVFDPTNLSTFGGLFHRDSTGHLSTDGTLCPGSNCGYVDLRTQNLGDLATNGVDFAGTYRIRSSVGTFTTTLSSTWVYKYLYQNYTNGPWQQNVGVYSGAGPVFRWQHNVTVIWNKDAFTVGLSGHYKTGYLDEDPSNTVSPYATMDLFGTWKPTKKSAITLGITNLFDRDPPFSNQTDTFAAGYDSRFADPTGRTFYVRGSYDF